MNKNFWLQKWETNDIAFHRSEANPSLVKHFAALSLAQDGRVFVPLCGKTLDIAWLLSQGYRVAGAELAEIAVEQLFSELGTVPKMAVLGEAKYYSAESIDIFVGDVLQLSKQTLGSVDAVYDRAALVALPEPVRSQYAAHLIELTNRAPQLLITYEYDQSLMAGPPFSIGSQEVHRYYGDYYSVSLAASTEIPGGLKGKCAAQENVWLLQEI